MVTKRVMTRDERIDILIAQYGDLCFYPECGKPFNSRADITFDHWWVPQSKGGTWEIENLRLMHKRCNALKGDRVPNADGTLPSQKRDLNSAERRAARRGQRPEICTTCNSGRLLGPDEFCEACGAVPMPFRHPQWAKLSPNDCDHSGVWWCWCCMSGVVNRVPAIYDVLSSDEIDE